MVVSGFINTYPNQPVPTHLQSLSGYATNQASESQSVNTSAFVGTNPADGSTTSSLPVIGSEPQQFRQADFNDASRKPLLNPCLLRLVLVNNRI
jgi:hypothetical protein